jgi:pyruvate dehydrogenase E2 component (dihydrolipoamide acetyltransferase)
MTTSPIFRAERTSVQEIYVPALGMASDGVYLAEWTKEPGDTIAEGEVIARIETDKAELDVESPGAGILGRHLFAAETEVPSGATIAYLLGADETEPSAGSAAPELAAVAPAPTAVPAAAQPAVSAPVAARSALGPLTPEDRRRDPLTGEREPYTLSPKQRQAELARVDVAPPQAAPIGAVPQPAISAAPTPASTDRYRAAVAQAVSRSWAEIPHFAVNREIRVEKLQEVLTGFRTITSQVTFTDVLLKAFALSLVERFGSTEIDLGLAVATPRGVAIPVLRDVARRDLMSIAGTRKAAVERAIGGQMNADDGVTPRSTLSNLGAYGVDSFTGIVPFGQTSILTTGASSLRPVVENGELAVGSAMNLTLNVDHRVWDGQHAAEVLQRFAAIAASPTLLLALS